MFINISGPCQEQDMTAALANRVADITQRMMDAIDDDLFAMIVSADSTHGRENDGHLKSARFALVPPFL